MLDIIIMQYVPLPSNSLKSADASSSSIENMRPKPVFHYQKFYLKTSGIKYFVIVYSL